jgi:hypothetical protein
MKARRREVDLSGLNRSGKPNGESTALDVIIGLVSADPAGPRPGPA